MPLLAPICLAREPNAFTLIDSTCFYFNAVNQAGFLRMVGVAIDGKHVGCLQVFVWYLLPRCP